MSEDGTWHMRGEGGGIFEMTLPLDPNIEKRYFDGAITRVNPDGTPWRERAARRPRASAAAAGKLGSLGDAGPVRDG